MDTDHRIAVGVGMTESYPLSVLDCTFPFLAGDTDVIVIASASHFGVLVSLDKLPPPKKRMKKVDIVKLLVQGVSDGFAEMAEDYVEASDANNFTAPLPNPANLTDTFEYVTLQITGRIGHAHASPPTDRDLILDGDYLFIAEVGVDIGEFFAGANVSDRIRVLH